MEPWHYIALLGAVIAVWALGMPRNRTSNPPVQSVQNMEMALEQFMENMEKDNDELLQMLAKSQAEAKQEEERKDVRIAALEQRCETLGVQLQQTLDKLAQASASASGEGIKPVGIVVASAPPASIGEETSASSRGQSIEYRYSELFRLYREGKSIEAIAKKLGMNKGEVQLIIGLAKQEGAHV